MKIKTGKGADIGILRGDYTKVPEGMTLRDYFAVMADEKDISAHIKLTVNDGLAVPDCSREQARYRYADAMLKARGVL